jgi:hypothetical protein
MFAIRKSITRNNRSKTNTKSCYVCTTSSSMKNTSGNDACSTLVVEMASRSTRQNDGGVFHTLDLGLLSTTHSAFGFVCS